MATLRIVLLGIYEHDAIGNFTRSIAHCVDASGMPCGIYAQDHSPALKIAGTYDDFFASLQPDDVLLYKFSNDDPYLSRFMEAPCRRVVYYHNITPGHFFRPYHSGIAAMLDRARDSLHLVSKAHAVFANSAWSLDDLVPHLPSHCTTGVMPPLTAQMLHDLTEQSTTFWGNLPVPYILTVGRLVPHKNIAWGLRLFAKLRMHMPHLSYVIMGGDGGITGYAAEIRGLLATLGEAADHVYFIGEVNEADATAWRCHATALLCASLHEGFGVPIVEAMVQQIPIVALDQPAVRETLQNAGCILCNKDMDKDAAQVASLLQSSSALAALRLIQKQRVADIRKDIINNHFWPVICSFDVIIT